MLTINLAAIYRKNTYTGIHLCMWSQIPESPFISHPWLTWDSARNPTERGAGQRD